MNAESGTEGPQRIAGGSVERDAAASPAKAACEALICIVEDLTPMNELRYALGAGGFTATPEVTARFVSLVVSRGWATLAVNIWPSSEVGAAVDVDAAAASGGCDEGR